ncbi:hypothetical protein [Aliarcobacter butzleri]|uniref:hypothetical protein n=1 Tax=Aliarcobacter butzleri TaxID=28197 RepID=UPI003AF65C3B
MKFIIYTHRYNVNSGGLIVLHFLCHLLNSLGEEAYLWPSYRPIFDIKKPFKSLIQILKYYKKELHRPFAINENWNTPILKNKKEVDNSIVVYPEIVKNNPLGAKYVVRWLLHKPGFHDGKVNFGKNELIFGYGEKFSTFEYPITKSNTLYLTYIMTDIYKQTNFSNRQGSCHMIRKGRNKNFVHEKSSLLVDGMTHEELNRIFNQKKYFISYDTYTYYSIYASLCGCISIVIPDDGISKTEWHPKIEDTYGLAYGIDDIEYAKNTKQKMIEYIKLQENYNMISVKNFVEKCNNYFYNK